MPVQRVTKYPLLLSRLQKVTPAHHKDKEAIRNAKEKIEAALEQMNKVRRLIENFYGGFVRSLQYFSTA